MESQKFDIMIGNPPCRTALIFVGIQGSGKTSFYRSCVEPFACGWKYVSMDLLHSRRKEEQEIRECVERGLPFVIDNTNPTAAERRRYLDMLAGKGYRVVCCFFRSRVKECVGRNRLRGGTVPAKAIAATSNRLELPSRDEGYDRMYYVKIVPPHFVVEEYIEDKEEEI